MRAVVFDIDHTIFDANRALHEGVADLLGILHGLGFEIGALTNNDHRMLVHLDEAGIRNYFSQVLCSDHTEQPKSVESVHRLVRQLGASLDETALVSHAHSDILLGKEVGFGRTVGVSHGYQKSLPLEEAGADHIVGDIPSVLDVLHW